MGFLETISSSGLCPNQWMNPSVAHDMTALLRGSEKQVGLGKHTGHWGLVLGGAITSCPFCVPLPSLSVLSEAGSLCPL
jgi:hypothetical protein